MEWLQLLPSCISVTSVVLSVVITLIVTHKQKRLKQVQTECLESDKEYETTLQEEITRLTATQEVIAKIPQKIKESETIFKSGNGAGKLAWCVSQLMLDVVKNDLDLTEKDLTTKIEEILDTPQKKQTTIQAN